MAEEENSLPILKVNNLTKTFGGLVAVDELSFSVPQGIIYGLIGPNGAGKTTVFNMITRFYKPDSGKVLFQSDQGEVDLLDYRVHEIIDLGVARTFQNIELFNNMTVIENLMAGGHSQLKTNFFQEIFRLPGFKAKEKETRQQALEILDFLGLAGKENQPASSQPYGVQKLLELGRILMAEPEIILLDEPAAGMNDSETNRLAKLLQLIKDEFDITIFLVEHDMSLVMDICQQITAINFGKKICQGSPAEIQASEAVQEAYLGRKEN